MALSRRNECATFFDACQTCQLACASTVVVRESLHLVEANSAVEVFDGCRKGLNWIWGRTEPISGQSPDEEFGDSCSLAEIRKAAS